MKPLSSARTRILCAALLVCALAVLALPASALAASETYYYSHGSLSAKAVSTATIYRSYSTIGHYVISGTAQSRTYGYNKYDRLWEVLYVDRLYAWAKMTGNGTDYASQDIDWAYAASATARVATKPNTTFTLTSVHRFYDGSMYHYKSLTQTYKTGATG